ncbi:MAG: hypothetical protein HYZ69_03850 [Candidatus Colwellbacteria bacterium]|nr:hypothetical protein [Candidatus Colwellbacteria bacterium]
MLKDRYIEQIFPIECKGRDAGGKEVLKDPVPVTVTVYQSPDDIKNISLSVTCKYNAGGHGQRCKASHKGVDKKGEGVSCPYGADIPYAFDRLNE